MNPKSNILMPFSMGHYPFLLSYWRSCKMDKYDPPSDPFWYEKYCPFCDYPLEDKGFSNFHDWVCINPKCEHSLYYDENQEE
jgi:hypothetical protein